MPATTPVHSCLDAAIEYALAGFPVFPVAAGTKRPACPNGVKQASTSVDRVRALWAAAPGAGVGIAGGGAARLVVLDVDGEQGRATVASLEHELGTLPDTRTASTPRGGEHRYYRFPPACDLARVKNSVGKLGPKLDVRATHGYVVAPPTTGYAWTHDGAVAELPRAWAERLLARTRHHDGYADAALRDAVERVSTAPEGARNDTLNREAYSLGGLVATGALAMHIVRESLIAAGIAAGLDHTEARATVDSGLAAGRQAPRLVPVTGGGSGPHAGSAARAEDAEPAGWESHLIYVREHLTAAPPNALLLLTHHDDWRGTIGYSQFRDRTLWFRAPSAVASVSPPRAGDDLDETHIGYVQAALSVSHGVVFPRTVLLDALTAAARECTRHEVRDYLDALAWDGTPRVEGWLHRYLGAEDSEYTRRVGTWWLVSAVARVYAPGCQVDHVVVLSGPQGCGKSSAVRILAGEWYLGSLPDLRDKDAVQALQGRWIVELGELDALRGAAATRVKDFLSVPVDCYRPSYGRLAVRRPRQCVFVGTTNDDHYLHDSTGARRFWPVPVGAVDRDALAADRDQLFAEARTLYRHGETWWPRAADAEMLAEAQEEAYVGDEWEPVVAEWLAGRGYLGGVTLGQVLRDALHLEPRDQDRSAQTRAGAALRRLGYVARQLRRDGGRVREYVRRGQ